MDRVPLAAPFPVGTRLRYVGPHKSWAVAKDGTRIPIQLPGMETVVDETRPGRRGTLRQCRDADGPMEYDDGEPILDTTRDGYSVYHYVCDGNRQGRCIFAKDAHEWEPVRTDPRP